MYPAASLKIALDNHKTELDDHNISAVRYATYFTPFKLEKQPDFELRTYYDEQACVQFYLSVQAYAFNAHANRVTEEHYKTVALKRRHEEGLQQTNEDQRDAPSPATKKQRTSVPPPPTVSTSQLIALMRNPTNETGTFPPPTTPMNARGGIAPTPESVEVQSPRIVELEEELKLQKEAALKLLMKKDEEKKILEEKTRHFSDLLKDYDSKIAHFEKEANTKLQEELKKKLEEESAKKDLETKEVQARINALISERDQYEEKNKKKRKKMKEKDALIKSLETKLRKKAASPPKERSSDSSTRSSPSKPRPPEPENDEEEYEEDMMTFFNSIMDLFCKNFGWNVQVEGPQDTEYTKWDEAWKAIPSTLHRKLKPSEKRTFTIEVNKRGGEYALMELLQSSLFELCNHFPPFQRYMESQKWRLSSQSELYLYCDKKFSEEKRPSDGESQPAPHGSEIEAEESDDLVTTQHRP